MGMRLQKFLAQYAELGSRRHVETLIQQERIKVNGVIAKLGQKVDPERDQVIFDKVALSQKELQKIVLAMHKPKGFICSHVSYKKEPIVFDLLPRELKRKRLFLAGRLDKDSEGLIILTNDGAFAQSLTHPSNQIVKRYKVFLSRPFNLKHRQVLLQGVVDNGERLYADEILFSNEGRPTRRLDIYLHQGRKREIRRMLNALGYEVKWLCRYQIGGLALKNLPKGCYRFLTKKEMSQLSSQSDKKDIC